MKKSEMVDRINEEIDEMLDNLFNSPVKQERYIMKNAASKILTTLESAGMLPPNSTDEDVIYHLNLEGYFEWEEEDNEEE